MTKRIVSMVMLFVLIFAVIAQAAETRSVTTNPYLSFSGTTATCFADLKSTNSSDKITATLTLYEGNNSVKSWSGSGTGKTSISSSCKVTKGKEYKLVLSYSVNGKAQSSVSTTGKCT